MTFSLGFIFSLLTALFTISGDTMIKVAADKSALSSQPMAAGLGLYAISAVCWFFAMRHMSLAEAAVTYSMLTLVALCVIGVVLFDEPLRMRDAMGVMLALAAMLMMAETR